MPAAFPELKYEFFVDLTHTLLETNKLFSQTSVQGGVLCSLMDLRY